MLKRILLGGVALASLAGLPAHAATTITQKNCVVYSSAPTSGSPASALVPCDFLTDGTNVWPAFLPWDGTTFAGVAPANTAATAAQGGLVVTMEPNSAALAVTGTFWQTTQPVSGTFWQATQPVSGTFWQATQPISGTVAATESGTWNITNVSGTVSLPTGAATATLQTTGNTALTTINTTLGSPFQAGGSIGNTSFTANAGTNLNTSALATDTHLTSFTSANHTDLTAINTTLGTPMQASGGTVTVTQATAANLKGQMSVVSGGIASGAVASGAYASGAFAAGSGVDGWDVTEGTKADTAWTSGSGSVISLLKTIAGAGASSSITGWAGTTIGTGTIQAFGATEATIGSGFVPAYNVHVTNTNPDITPGDAVTTTTYGAASPTIGIPFLWNGTAYDRQKELGSTGGALVGLNATPSLANGNGVVPTQGGSVLSATNGGYTNVLQGNAVLSATNGLYGNLLQGNAALTNANPIFSGLSISGAAVSATNGEYTNLLQGNAVIASGNPLFTQLTAGSANIGALTAGSAIIGKVGIDQTTPGTTNGVQVNAALPAGTNLMGKVGIDQTTPGTTNAVAPSTPVGSATLATGQSAGFTTSTLIVAARTGAPGTGRHNVTITNLGTVDTYCGNTGVTTSTGELLVGIKGASITLDSTAAIYCAAGSSSTVSYAETY